LFQVASRQVGSGSSTFESNPPTIRLEMDCQYRGLAVQGGINQGNEQPGHHKQVGTTRMGYGIRKIKRSDFLPQGQVVAYKYHLRAQHRPLAFEIVELVSQQFA